MEFRELSDDIIIAEEASPQEAADLLQQFQVGQCWNKRFRIKGNPNDTTDMTRYLTALQNAGLDIGRGDSHFGFRMPPPIKGEYSRVLQVFRRKL